MTEIKPAEMLEKFFACFTYKPGWSFEVERKYREGNPWTPLDERWDTFIVIRAEVPDIYNPEKTIQITGRYHFPLEHLFYAKAPEQVLIERIHWWVWDMEKHESDEWFRVDGVAVFNPHKTESEPSRSKSYS